MLNGFEELTYDLSKSEIELIDYVVCLLSEAKGKKNSITAKALAEKILEEKEIKIALVRIRAIVQRIRIEGRIPLLLAYSRGYYIASSIKEVNEYIESLEQRARMIDAIIDQLYYQKLKTTKTI